MLIVEDVFEVDGVMDFFWYVVIFGIFDSVLFLDIFFD